MRLRLSGSSFIILLLLRGFSFAQQTPPPDILSPSSSSSGSRYSISLSGSYTTSSQLFFDPNNAIDFLRGRSFEIDGITGIGVDVRRILEEHGAQIGLSVEYLSKQDDVPASDANGGNIGVRDGFTAVPIELTGYFRIPFSSDEFEMFIGGGGGVYIGSRQYEQAGVKADVTNHSAGYGIHVLSEVQYNMQPSLGLRFTVKFRDVQFRSTNAFPAQAGPNHQNPNTADQTPFDSRFQIDGMMMALGLVVRL